MTGKRRKGKIFSDKRKREKKAFYFFPDWKEVIKSGMSGKKSENGSKTPLSDVYGTFEYSKSTKVNFFK